MKTLTTPEFDAMIADGQILIADPSGEAMVVRIHGDCIVKKFGFRSDPKSRIYPRASRFRRNIRFLTSRGFRTVEVKEVFKYPESASHVVVYKEVPGQSLAECLVDDRRQEDDKRKLLRRAAGYYADLHRKGVYCRPTHFRNIIVCPDGEFGLIDVQNIRFRLLRLNTWKRARNFRWIFKHDSDQDTVISFGAKAFFESYMVAAAMSPGTRRIFVALLRWNVPRFFEPDTRTFLT